MLRNVKRKSWVIVLSVILICSTLSSFATYEFVKGQGASSLSAQTLSAGPYPGAPSYTIFTDGAGNYYAKNSAGSISFTSTVASTTIQEALNSLTTGGAILISSGAYPITTTIILASDEALIGAVGASYQGGSRLYLANGANCNLIQFGTASTPCQYSSVRFLTLEGNKGANSAGTGIALFNCLRCMVEDTSIGYFAGDGVNMTGAGPGNDDNEPLLSNDVIQANAGMGVEAATYVGDIIIDSCDIFQNGGYGVDALIGGMMNTNVWANVGGIVLGSNSRINGGKTEDNTGYGLTTVNGITDSAVVGCLVDENTGDGINIFASGANVASNVTIDGCTIVRNIGVPVSFTGNHADLTITNNVGYYTYESGSLSAVTNGATVTFPHAFSATPLVQLTSIGDGSAGSPNQPYILSLYSVSAIYFNVNLYFANGTAVTSNIGVTMDWTATYEP